MGPQRVNVWMIVEYWFRTCIGVERANSMSILDWLRVIRMYFYRIELDYEKDQAKSPKWYERPDHTKYTNIGSGTACDGSIMTFSFHVQKANVIKLYLHCQGNCIRFMPEDIRTILPLLFNKEFGNNRQWIDCQSLVDGYIDRMRRGLID